MNGALALLIFQFRSGARLSIRAFAPLFSVALAWIMIQMYPAAMVRHLARAAFAAEPGIDEALLFVFLAFLLPSWSAPRLSRGLLAWMRHLPLSDRNSRAGLIAALVSVQLPAGCALALLGIVASTEGMPVLIPAVRWLLISLAGAVAALPVCRQWLLMPAAVIATGLALWGGGVGLGTALAELAAAAGVSGRLRKARPMRAQGGVTRFLDTRISWRALGWRTASCFLPALALWGATLLFIANNDLTGAVVPSVARFGACFSSGLLLSSLAGRLAVARPPWPWARSLPVSSARRVAADAGFLALHNAPLLMLQALSHPWSAAAAAVIVPLLSLRAVRCMRDVPEFRTATISFIAEGFALSSIAALVWWSVVLLPAASVPAFFLAREADRRTKVTRWLELHHSAVGDSQSLEGR